MWRLGRLLAASLCHMTWTRPNLRLPGAGWGREKEGGNKIRVGGSSVGSSTSSSVSMVSGTVWRIGHARFISTNRMVDGVKGQTPLHTRGCQVARERRVCVHCHLLLMFMMICQLFYMFPSSSSTTVFETAHLTACKIHPHL